MKDICKKDIFARIVNRNQKYFPEVFSKLTPQTFILPEDLDDLKQRAKNKKKFFIVKPSGGAQGEGILIVSGMRDIEKYAQGDRIVQSYLAKPLLLYDKKFDLRVYTIIVNTSPISCFLCREGLARFATKEYIPPGQTTRLDYFMHLTNYSLNKRSEDFVMTEEIALANEASKQTMTSLFAGLQAQGYDTQTIWSNITQAVSSMVSTIVPFIMIESQLRKAQFGQNKLFQIIGVDVILDRKLNAYVLEINNNPSLAIYFEHELIKEKQINQVDQFIKYQVIKDSFKLLRMTEEEILGTSLLKFSDRIQVEPNIDLVNALQLFVNIQGIKQTPYLTGGKFQKLFSILKLRENGIQKPDLDIIFSMIQSRFGVMDIHSFLDALEILGGKILSNREARGIEKILAVLSKQI